MVGQVRSGHIFNPKFLCELLFIIILEKQAVQLQYKEQYRY